MSELPYKPINFIFNDNDFLITPIISWGNLLIYPVLFFIFCSTSNQNDDEVNMSFLKCMVRKSVTLTRALTGNNFDKDICLVRQQLSTCMDGMTLPPILKMTMSSMADRIFNHPEKLCTGRFSKFNELIMLTKQILWIF